MRYIRWWSDIIKNIEPHESGEDIDVCLEEDISEDTGYDTYDIKIIKSLKVGDTYMMDNKNHIITRVV